jgi:hypothetical protein
MMVVGAIINMVFAGFVIIRVPFPLTIRFKQMLQRGKCHLLTHTHPTCCLSPIMAEPIFTARPCFVFIRIIDGCMLHRAFEACGSTTSTQRYVTPTQRYVTPTSPKLNPFRALQPALAHKRGFFSVSGRSGVQTLACKRCALTLVNPARYTHVCNH